MFVFTRKREEDQPRVTEERMQRVVLWFETASRARYSSSVAPAAGAVEETSAAATAAEVPPTEASGAPTEADPPYTFKSAAHRDMVVLMTRLHLQDLLLQRFGRLRTAECELLRKVTGTPRLLLLWAELLVQENPANPPANAYFVPPQLYALPEVKALLRKDKALRWLMQRIDPKGRGGPCDATKDCVPSPHFPSVLLQQVPQFPYEPQQLEMMRDSGDVQRAKSKVLTHCSSDVLYAPDETETGAYVWH
ncbi:hypothetical protein cyc_00811 [Cyclospora cayetanensis]|uniref:Uncharacterized protein n=1 Tax=Cyclospora cayetanensis TaxID=88456 RepID=A0A1D3CRS7_9EIME|nr:hypothetical protein cyc_00811 [Cyclospora cayetanensis]